MAESGTRRLFVVNAQARGAHPGAVRAIREWFEARARDAGGSAGAAPGAGEFRAAASWREARDLTRAALAGSGEAAPGGRAIDRVIALGGDGTVNAVVNGFFDERGRAIRPQAALAVSRLGTGADYARSVFESAPHADWRETALRGTARPVDLGRVMFDSSEGREPLLFANVLTAGITAEIVRLKGAAPAWLSARLPKDLAYLGPTVLELLRNRSYRATLDTGEAGASGGSTAAGAALERDLVALFVAKGARLGSGMRVSREARLADGKLAVIAVSRMSVPRLLWKLRDLYRAGLEAQAGVERFEAAAIRIGGEGIPFECDGEVQGRACFAVETLPAAIQVVFP